MTLNIRNILSGLAFLTLLAIVKMGAAQDNERPSIIIFIADDLTFRDIEPYGSEAVNTPNLSRLAEEGICLDGMYTSTAMCAPARQQLLTGMYPVRNGAYPNHSWVYEGVKSLPYYLNNLGYRVGMVGKRHFGPPQSFPFEKIGSIKGDIQKEKLKAITRFIADAQSPFCLYVASHQPHKPWNSGSKLMYDPDKLVVPPYLIDLAVTRQQLSKYYAEVTFVDHEVGSVMDVLEKSGKADNTVFIFISEQGAQFPFAKWTCYENGLKTAFIVRWPGRIKPKSRSKALVQYVDVVPTLIQIAGGDPASVTTGRTDAEGGSGFDGKSFLPVLLGKTATFREYVYGIHTTLGIIGGKNPYPIRSVFDGRYKLILNLNSGKEFFNISRSRENSLFNSWIKASKKDSSIADRVKFYYKRPPIEFYDLKHDPYELNNLSSSPKYQRQIELLSVELKKWMKQQGDEGLITELSAKNRLPENITK